MLNAFNAYSILELAPKERFKIESLLAYGDKLLLGLSNGTLRIYKVLSPDSEEISLSLQRSLEKFSRRSIELLACIKEVQILVSLSDNYVHIHDLNDFTLTETLAKTRGASTFAVTSNIERDEMTLIPSIVSRLAIGVKKRLLLYSWHDEEFLEGKEVVLSGAVRSLTWACGRKVVAGLAGGFVVIDVKTGVTKEIVPPETKGGAAGPAGGETAGWGAYMGMGGWGSKPLSTYLGGEDLLLVKDTTTLFVDSKGAVIPDRPPIPWPASPDAIAFSYPYLVSLSTAKQHLEVRNPSTYTLLQTIHLNNVSTLHVPPPNVSLVHAGKLFYVGSSTQVWRMTAADYEKQIKQLVEGEHLDEAISLLEILESVLLKDSKEEQLREVQMLKAERLFEKRKYQESMDLFTKVSAPPERVIRMFPRVIAGDLSICEGTASDSVDSAEQAERSDGGGSRTATPECEACSPSSDSIKPKEAEAPLQNGKPEPKKPNGTPETASILNFSLTRKQGDGGSILNFGSKRNTEESDAASIAIKHTETVPDGPLVLEGSDLENAADKLSAFLNDTRQRLSKYFNPDGTIRGDPASIIVSGSPGSASKRNPFEASFVAAASSLPSPTPTDGDPSSVRIQKLLQAARLVDTTLFKIYIITRPGLVGPFVRIQKHGDPEVFSEKLRELGKYTELIDFLYQRELHREALELLLQFGKSSEERAPALHGPRRTITYLQSLKATHIGLVLEFSRWPLEESPEAGMEIFTTDSENAESLPRAKVLEFLQEQSHHFAVQYLEHVIHELGDRTPEFHTRLVRLYLTLLKEDSANAVWRERFLEFLISSKQYRSEKVLGWLPRDDPAFYEARAVVLRNMGQHKAALEIYVFKLHDHAKAEEYCTATHLSTPTTPTIYHTLLSLYLRPPPPHTVDLPPALHLLSRHGSRLSASETLALIPEDTKMASLTSYFQSRIRTANTAVADTRLRAMLRRSYLVHVQEHAVEATSGHVVVGEERGCGVCHKRLGASVLLRLPGGAVIHYGCAQKAG